MGTEVYVKIIDERGSIWEAIRMAVASLRHPNGLSAKCVSSSSSTVFPTIVFMPIAQKDFIAQQWNEK